MPWGLALAAVLGLSLAARNWTGSGWLALALLVYLGGIRPTRCRVETQKHTPCKWRVRSYLRCSYHHSGQNLKWSLPTLHRGRRLLPVLMWPRDDLAAVSPVPQPRPGGNAYTEHDRRWSTQEKAATLIALASLLVAIMSFVRDVMAS